MIAQGASTSIRSWDLPEYFSIICAFVILYISVFINGYLVANNREYSSTV